MRDRDKRGIGIYPIFNYLESEKVDESLPFLHHKEMRITS